MIPGVACVASVNINDTATIGVGVRGMPVMLMMPHRLLDVASGPQQIYEFLARISAFLVMLSLNRQ